MLAVFLLADVTLFLSVLIGTGAKFSLAPALIPTAEYLLQNPAPKPDFINFLDAPDDCAVNISFGQYIPTDTDIENYFTLTIDGVQVQFSPYLLSAYSGPLSCRGQYPNLECLDGGMFCYAKAGLNDGLHLAEVRLTDLDGIEHSYTWAFHYDPNFPTSDPNILPTAAILPTETPTA